MKKLKYKEFPKCVIKTREHDGFAPVFIVIAIVCIALLYGWMQGDDEAHKVVDKSYAEETRKDMAKQSEAAKRQAKWDELNAEANTFTGYAGVMK